MNTQLSAKDKDKEILNKLLDFYQGATKEILQRDKYVIPMLVVVDKDGELSFQGLVPANAQEHITDQLEAYRELLRGTVLEHDAYLLGYDVRLKEREDYQEALAIEAEIRGGAQIMLYLPYKFFGIRRRLVFGSIERVEPSYGRLY